MVKNKPLPIVEVALIANKCSSSFPLQRLARLGDLKRPIIVDLNRAIDYGVYLDNRAKTPENFFEI